MDKKHWAYVTPPVLPIFTNQTVRIDIPLPLGASSYINLSDQDFTDPLRRKFFFSLSQFGECYYLELEIKLKERKRGHSCTWWFFFYTSNRIFYNGSTSETSTDRLKSTENVKLELKFIFKGRFLPFARIACTPPQKKKH